MHVQQNLFDKKIYDSVKDEFLMFIIVNLKFVYLRLKEEFKDDFLNSMKDNYDDLHLGDVSSLDGWHYEDQSFYKSINVSRNSEIFDLNYEIIEKIFVCTNNLKSRH